MIKCLVLLTGIVLIAKIEEIDAELGDPNCLISDVCLINPDGTISPWLDFSEDTESVSYTHLRAHETGRISYGGMLV